MGAAIPALRLLLGGLCVAAGFFLMGRGGSGMLETAGVVLIGCGLLLAGAILLQPLVSSWLARPAGRLFYPEERFAQPLPLYSLAESKVMKHDFEGALAMYRDISEAHPGELKPLVDGLRVLVVHLQDVPRADRLFNDALEGLSHPDQQERLREAYGAIRSLGSAPPSWQETRTLSVSGQRVGPDKPGAG